MASHADPRPQLTALPSWKSLLARFGRGALIGVAVVDWTHHLLTTFGTSIAVVSAMTLALGAAPWLRAIVSDVADSRGGFRWKRPAAWGVIAIWTAVLPWLIAPAKSVLSIVPVTALTSDASVFCLMLPILAGLLAVPAVAALSVLRLRAHASDGLPAEYDPLALLGMACGLASGPSVLAPLVGLPFIMVAITAITAGCLWKTLARSLTCRQVPKQSPAAEPHVEWWALGVSLAIGFMIPLLAGLTTLLVPGSAFEHYAVWAGLLGGVSLGLMASARFRRSRLGPDAVVDAAVVAAAWPVIVLAVWQLLVHGVLTVNSSISFVPLVMLLRILLTAATTAPLGFALGRIWSVRPAPRMATESAILATVVGIVLSISVAASPLATVSLVSVGCMMAAAARYWEQGLPAIGPVRKTAGVMAVVAVAFLPLVHNNYRPDLAARLLFSTQTFAALQAGTDRDHLPQLDDSRLIAVHEGRESTWTVWKQRGSQLAIRENGLPRGVISADPQTSPQFAGEVMPAVIPMVLHQRAESVLMLGVGSSATLSSLLACPVASVTCIEGDADLIQLIDELIAPATGVNPLNDDRVRLVNADPTLAVLASPERYDVVLLNDSQPSLLSSSSGFTREFYEAARGRLNETGLLCQRLQYADFGRAPLEDLLATIQSVLPTVALFDAAPGEMLIVATAAEGPLVDETTIARCAAPHIRNLMAQVGWDWSVLMNLGAISPQNVRELTATRGTPNTVANGRFAFGLPQEVMRWSPPQLPKWLERQRMLTAHADRMLAWVGESDRVQDVQQRLADVIEQQRLISENPDHYWAYRKTLKERLLERPRATIRQVKHEGLKRTLHPEDERRKEYLLALDAAATRADPQLRDIRELAEFAIPYDPLVSYFLHREAARLYEKASQQDPLSRYRHLRYSIFFGPPNDQSVRNVIAALQLLTDHPDVVDDDLERWDEMNSLLEVLKQRSSLRLHLDDSASSFELVDAERSIRIAEATMAAMDRMRTSTPVPADDWQHRKAVLKQRLIRPMWKYHAQQAARLAKRQAQAKAITAERDTPATTR